MQLYLASRTHSDAKYRAGEDSAARSRGLSWTENIGPPECAYENGGGFVPYIPGGGFSFFLAGAGRRVLGRVGVEGCVGAGGGGGDSFEELIRIVRRDES